MNLSFENTIRIPFLLKIEGPDEVFVWKFLENVYDVSSRDPLGYRTLRIRLDFHTYELTEERIRLLSKAIVAYVERFDAKATVIDTRPS